MSALDPRDADKLVKLLGMLGSDHAGERAAAGLKAHSLIAGAGLDWRDLIAVAATSEPVCNDPKAARRAMYPGRGGPPQRAELLRDHQRDAWLLLASGFRWDDWKRGFLNSIRQCPDPLSQPQKNKLRECRRAADDWRAEREMAA